MSWRVPRILSAMVAVGSGGLLGLLVGQHWRYPALVVLLGALLGAVLHASKDIWQSQRFLNWLRGEQELPAPRDAGLWGEVGYRVERALRLAERRVEQQRSRLDEFLTAIDASPNGVLMLDQHDQIAWCNTLAAEHFGLHPQRDVRQHITNLVRAPAFVSLLQSGRYADGVTIPSPNRRGTLSVLIRRYGEGQKLVLSQDITELERNEAMRRDFVANVSHEIRTPLTVLTGFIETMANLPLTEVERKRVMELMNQQAQRMQTLVGDLLILAQLEGSPRPPSDRWVPVQQLLAQVLADAQALSAGRHTVSLVDSPSLAALQVAGAQGELLSAMGNLAVNAVRYTPAGGTVEIHCRLRADDACEISVKDSGIGIEREHLPRLTERFYRVDGSRSRDTGGTGLGLSIVKHVVQRHGGELDIRSEPGQGSCFTITLPPSRVRIQDLTAQAMRPGLVTTG